MQVFFFMAQAYTYSRTRILMLEHDIRRRAFVVPEGVVFLRELNGHRILSDLCPVIGSEFSAVEFSIFQSVEFSVLLGRFFPFFHFRASLTKIAIFLSSQSGGTIHST